MKTPDTPSLDTSSLDTSSLNPSAKKNEIKQMFSTIAPKYDRANTILSMGIHHMWRNQLISWSEAKDGDQVLDCATGTGDLAIAFKKTVGSKGEVIGTDFCQQMLDLAPKKAKSQNLEVKFEQADVTQLPYEDNYFDISSISFGIRNVDDPQKALKELARVTKPNGLVMILEFGTPKLPLFNSVYRFYSKKILPTLGGWISGDRKAYKYLEESSSEFPCRESFLKKMADTKMFSETSYRPVSFGIAYIYKGRKAS